MSLTHSLTHSGVDTVRRTDCPNPTPSMATTKGKHRFSSVHRWTGLISGWVTNWIDPVLYSLEINHAFHLYNKCCIWVEFQSISTGLRGFSPRTPISSLLKIDSQSNPSGCGAVLRGQTWVVFRDRAPSWLHSSFDPTSLSCVLRNSVSDCEKGRLAGQILLTAQSEPIAILK